MKTLYPKTSRSAHSIHRADSFRKLILFLLFIALAIIAAAQSGGGNQVEPLEFRNPILVTGTAGADGSIYRFERVGNKVDALVKITKRSDTLVRLVDIDVKTAGFDKAFQPQVSYNGTVTPAGVSNWWMEFEISFVIEKTSTPATVSAFDVTGLDIDGNAHLINENVVFYGPRSYTLEANSILQVTNVVDTPTGLVIGKKFQGPVINFISIDTMGTAVMTTNSYVGANKMIMRAGGYSSDASGASDRLYSFWFKSFYYNSAMEIFLPVRLRSFRAQFKNNATQLNWVATNENPTTLYAVERSTNGVDYKEVSIVFGNGRAGVNEYFYNDKINNSINGMISYRLKINEKSGSAQYSQPRLIRTGEKKESLTVRTDPNPVTNDLRITIPSYWQDKQVRIDLYNGNGRIIKQVISNRASQTEIIGLGELAAGSYVVRITAGNETVAQQVIKSN